MAEAGDPIAALRKRIERILEKRRAFNENTAVNPEEAGINYKRVLELMNRGGIIAKTPEGKIYLTEKGRKKE